MSPDRKTGGGGFNPPDSARLTLGEMKEMVDFFKRVFEDSSLAMWIKVAGIGAALEALHVLWLLIRYIGKF